MSKKFFFNFTQYHFRLNSVLQKRRWIVVLGSVPALFLCGIALGFFIEKSSRHFSSDFLPVQTVVSPAVGSAFSAPSGVTPHHLLAKSVIEDFFNALSKDNQPETIILLGPDHFNASALSAKKAIISLDSSDSVIEGFPTDDAFLNKLASNIALDFNSSAVLADHGIADLLPFIKKYFPSAKILPFLVPFNISQDQIKNFVSALDGNAPKTTLLLASVDFSHYLPRSVADFHDIKSIDTLLNFREEEFGDLDVDCPYCLYASRFFAKLRQAEFPTVIAHKNAADFLVKKGTVEPMLYYFPSATTTEEITSYFSVIFNGKKQKSENNFEATRTVLFVGDIMLDRNVESLMRKNNYFYPFKKIKGLLRGVDIVFGNLEGPIIKKPKEFSFDSLKFVFPADIIPVLSSVGFNVFSLANNHTLDMGKEGLKEARVLFKEAGINFVGDPLSCDFSEKLSFRPVSFLEKNFGESDGILFLAFNKTFENGCRDEEIINAVKAARSFYKNDFLAVSMHWGTEYQPKNSSAQQNLARKIIDAGADLIVGHHPHVVQNIELYKNKLIFYSLGNFIFDQYFSEETQNGLALGAEIYPGKVIYRLFPVKSRLSQPFLMDSKEAMEFLEKLAAKSSPELSGLIKNGIIEINNN